ncbi:cyclic nucleotide-binding domain-containing protein [Streptomyces sp. LX-29]|uniref:cyclic nucleotide-binding domain-containing protein n=1 Tax=Streptomyces sp. LX-29 TaxID=2900152 RepID=UPI00240D3D46|nr:cyclic nucleotide-binding domain-containing protein [Streptomyces sp. LX-29]WFB06385.1 cyclic nucleotide-binding domain-containing protein [Streptomyces sp. LX-29]
MSRLLSGLSAEHRARLMELAHDVAFASGARIFEEGGKADRFWIIRTGSVTLDMRVPGRRPAVIETLGPGELLGWSWLFPPGGWHLGAEALSPVRAHEFESEVVRQLCRDDTRLGYELVLACAQAMGHRLQSARTRLLDLYGPYGTSLPGH